MALGVGSPRHFSAGSLPVPGTQSLSLMVIRGALRSPSGEETTGRPQVSEGARAEPGVSYTGQRYGRSPWAGHGAVTLSLHT